MPAYPSSVLGIWDFENSLADITGQQANATIVGLGVSYTTSGVYKGSYGITTNGDGSVVKFPLTCINKNEGSCEFYFKTGSDVSSNQVIMWLGGNGIANSRVFEFHLISGQFWVSFNNAFNPYAVGFYPAINSEYFCMMTWNLTGAAVHISPVTAGVPTAPRITHAIGVPPTWGTITHCQAFNGFNGLDKWKCASLDWVRFTNKYQVNFPTTDLIDAPTSITATPSTSSVALAWGDNSSAARYLVWMNTTNDFATASKVDWAAQGEQAAQVAGLTSGTSYYFWVQPEDSYGVLGSVSAAVSATTLTQSAPTSLTAGTPTTTTIPLTWSDPANVGQVLVFKSTENNSATASLVGAALAGVEAFTVEGLTASTEYWFWTKAVGTDGSVSGFSAVATATTAAPAAQPNPPTAITATVVDRHTVQLAWTDFPEGEYYHVFLGDAALGLAAQGDGGFTATGLDPDTEHTFTVVTEAAGQLSDASAPVTATTPAAPAPTGLAAAASGTRGIRITWTDSVDSDAGYVGFIGTSADFSLATQCGYAPAGQEFIEVPDLPYATLHRLWLVAVDSLGFGPTTGPVTATTGPAPEDLDGALVIEHLQDALQAFVASATTRTVIWRYEGGTRPAKGFVELHLVGPIKPGQDEETAGEVGGPRRFKLTVRVFNDRQAVALQDAVDIQNATERSDLLSSLQAAGYAFGEVGEIQDTSGLLESKWEARREFEIDVHAVSVTPVEDGQIDTAIVTDTTDI